MVEADPHRRHDVGRVADEPGVAVIARRPGFPGDVAEAVALQPRGRAAQHHAAQQRVHHVHRRGRSDLLRIELVEEELLAAGVADLADEQRLDADAEVRERRVRRRELPHRHLGHAERQRRDARELLLEAEGLDAVEHVLAAAE